jgi:mannose-6-phosphate isomerase-like protein (cupin superfamily)
VSEAGLPAHYTDFAARTEAGVSAYTTHRDLDGSGLRQQLITVEPASRIERQVPEGREEVLYVVAGCGQLRGDGGTCELGPDIAVLMGGSQCYELEAASTGAPLEVVAVSGRSLSKTTVDPSRARIDLAQQIAEDATSNREFRVLHDPRSGCSGITQFIGYIPQVRTDRHYHPYSEMLCVVSGHGLVQIEGRQQRVSPGWCFYLPEGTPHLVENTSTEYLRLLGVFTPPGSPAQAIPLP